MPRCFSTLTYDPFLLVFKSLLQKRSPRERLGVTMYFIPLIARSHKPIALTPPISHEPFEATPFENDCGLRPHTPRVTFHCPFEVPATKLRIPLLPLFLLPIYRWHRRRWRRRRTRDRRRADAFPTRAVNHSSRGKVGGARSPVIAITVGVAVTHAVACLLLRSRAIGAIGFSHRSFRQLWCYPRYSSKPGTRARSVLALRYWGARAKLRGCNKIKSEARLAAVHRINTIKQRNSSPEQFSLNKQAKKSSLR